MTRRHNNIRDRVVAIPGGARGIGKATGEAFLRAGARVALGDIDTELVENRGAVRPDRHGAGWSATCTG